VIISCSTRSEIKNVNTQMLHKNRISTSPVILVFSGNELKKNGLFSIKADYHEEREHINDRSPKKKAPKVSAPVQ